MRDIGSANVQGTLYDLLSPRVVGDYIENIGAACQNPDGYAANKIFVAYDSSMNQHLYKTTAQITQGTQITSSNCEQTSLSELLSGSGSSSSLEDLSDTDISSKTAGDIVEYNNSTGKWENTQKLVNLEKSIAPVEDGATLSQAYAIGEKFIRGGVRYKAKTDLASGTQFSSLIINTNYEAADDVSSEIQTLTNNLSNEVETRAKLGAHNLVDINGFTLIKASARIKYIYPSDIIHGAIPSEQVVISFRVTDSNLSKSDNYFKAYSSDGEIGAVSFKANGRYSFVFDGASFSNFYIFISSEAESDETCTISEIMITLVTDASTEYAPYAMTNRELTDRIVVHTDTITFNENGKYIFIGGKEIISARVLSTGNYVVLIGNNAEKSVFVLYNHEGTNWTRVTTQPQLTVKWVEVVI